MLPLLGILLGALKFAPAVLSAGTAVAEAVTGKSVPEAAKTSPEALADYVGTLPEDQQAAITEQVIAAKVRTQETDTERFKSMNEGDADKIRATARPQIALRAMGVIETFSWAFKLLCMAVAAEYLIRAGFMMFGCETAAGEDGGAIKVCASFPESLSITSMLSSLAPVSEMIWGPLVASFWVSADVIKKYMGCRERDKARADEIRAGRSLDSTAATIEAAGGGIAGIIKAFRK